ncbi:MAG: hypothetical protein K6E54_05490 [Bacteroidaceae bacterium]|nr:hypothetical protein [Bacteroidaceae bacterium]
MTEEERFSIRQFEAKVNKLIAEYGVLKQENKSLKEELKIRDEKISALNTEIDQSRKDYDNLKLAKMISISDNDLKGAKQKITKLVRDVNKCISILSAEKQEDEDYGDEEDEATKIL